MSRPGAIWVRRETQGDAYDRLRVVGAAPDGHGIVVVPVEGFGSPVSADPTQLGQLYELTIEPDESPVEAWQTALSDLASRP